MVKYINAKSFNEFKDNQKKLIEILNHNMTKMQVNVSWLKKLI